ncbi:MAG: tRNA glutamyl-Q(34) synthetase GluQRS [Porticoccaceae bacterium]|nr:tRNA glutamyl-Q(34) synthetase GluQRS [Porticoccaceae bacterium]
MLEPYTGRFAPSPTGPLHFGSLLAALVSYLDARAHGGKWLVRMEDLDPPREVPGAASHILRQLEDHGLFWDAQVLFQSQRQQRYGDILQHLFDKGVAYYCDCSRQAIRAMGGVYSGRCYGRHDVRRQGAAVRLHIADNTTIEFCDLFQGIQRQCLNTEVGDFIVRRKDGLYAYQLAVVVDDCDQSVTHVLRGMDLLDSTARQLWLMAVLGYQQPVYGHLPVALNRSGQKLSKQNHAPSLDQQGVCDNLYQALSWLGIELEAGIVNPEEILHCAVKHWQRSLLMGRRGALAPRAHAL